MAANPNIFNPRLADRKLFLVAAIAFPLIVLIGYFRTFYFQSFFDVPPIPNALVMAHGVIMSLWVIYFVAQVFLIRTKNVKLHITMGFAGIGLAVVMVVVGLATAYDSQLVRGSAPPGVPPHSFFLIPVTDMVVFVFLFAGAIYYRKRPAEHKGLMLLTAINFVPAAIARIPGIPPEHILTAAFASPCVFALAALGWHTWKHRKLNWVFALGAVFVIASVPFRILFSGTQIWLSFTAWLASL
jgi:hypothetical protein